jgi:uncharacterized Ntn-hydrolase superfamily protein
MGLSPVRHATWFPADTLRLDDFSCFRKERPRTGDSGMIMTERLPRSRLPSRTPRPRPASALLSLLAFALAANVGAGPLHAQAAPAEPFFHTFSIAAVDQATGESGVAVTTRVACVGNVVPWVRAGVGAVATQSWTRVEYGPELLDLLEAGMTPTAALEERVAADEGRERRQVAVIAMDGRGAQFTGSEATPWAGERSGPWYVAQGNLLVGPEVLDAVAASFEAGQESGRHLADRLIEALEAGQAAGGDARAGRLQSAALLVADPREGRAIRPDRVTTNLNVCEHPEPVGELRRQYEAVGGALGYRTLEHPVGSDVAQLKIILHALGHYRPEQQELERDDDWLRYTREAADAVDRFRAAEGLSTPRLGSPPGFVDRATVARLWEALERAGLDGQIRVQIRDFTAIRR